MGNCLVTKLKGTVDNSGLYEIGELRLSVDKVENPTVDNRYFSINPRTDIEVIGGTLTDDAHVSNDNCIIKIKTKYECQSIETASGNLSIRVENEPDDIFRYNNVLRTLNAPFTKEIDLNKFSDYGLKNTLVTFFIERSAISGDIEALRDYTALNSIAFNNANVKGDIVNFGKSINISSLFVSGSGLSGSVKALAEAQVANGRTSGSFTIHFEYFYDGSITIDGVTPLTTSATVSFSPSYEGGYNITVN